MFGVTRSEPKQPKWENPRSSIRITTMLGASLFGMRRRGPPRHRLGDGACRSFPQSARTASPLPLRLTLTLGHARRATTTPTTDHRRDHVARRDTTPVRGPRSPRPRAALPRCAASMTAGTSRQFGEEDAGVRVARAVGVDDVDVEAGDVHRARHLSTSTVQPLAP